MVKEVKTDSPFRTLTKQPLQQLMWHIHGLLPGLEPDHLTYAGTVAELGGVLATTQLQTKTNLPRIIRVVGSVAAIGLPQLTDGLDGALARVLRERCPEHATDPIEGALSDYRADREQEIAQALGRACVAHQRGSKMGEILAYGALLTNPLTSLSRAWAERNGVRVKEFEWSAPLGNRLGRSVSATVAGAVPEWQPVLDLVGIVSNLMSTYTRYQIALDGGLVEGEEDLKTIAERKINDSYKFIASGVVSAIALAAILRNRQ